MVEKPEISWGLRNRRGSSFLKLIASTRTTERKVSWGMLGIIYKAQEVLLHLAPSSKSMESEMMVGLGVLWGKVWGFLSEHFYIWHTALTQMRSYSKLQVLTGEQSHECSIVGLCFSERRYASWGCGSLEPHQIDQGGWEPQRCVCLCFLSTGITSIAQCPPLWLGLWDSNLGLQSCIANYLVTVPSPQPEFWYFYLGKASLIL